MFSAALAESLQLNRVCLWIDAGQVLLKVSAVQQHCTLSHWHLSVTYVKLSPSMAGDFINRYEPWKNNYKKHHAVGLAQKEVLEGLKGIALCSRIFMCLELEIATELMGGMYTNKFHLFENR